MEPPDAPGTWLGIALLASLLLVTAGLVWRNWRLSGHALTVYVSMRLLWVFCNFWHGVRPRGRDPLPPNGPAIVISNHTSPADPLFLQYASRRIILFMMAREFFSLKWLRPIFYLDETILVNRTGRDVTALRAALRAIRKGRVIGIFPEGWINLNTERLGEARPGAALMALRMRVPVIPAFIAQPRHTNRLWEGIMYPAHARVIFGRPIDLSPYYDRDRDRTALTEAARCMMEAIEALRPRPDQPYSVSRSAGRVPVVNPAQTGQ